MLSSSFSSCASSSISSSWTTIWPRNCSTNPTAIHNCGTAIPISMLQSSSSMTPPRGANDFDPPRSSRLQSVTRLLLILAQIGIEGKKSVDKHADNIDWRMRVMARTRTAGVEITFLRTFVLRHSLCPDSIHPPSSSSPPANHCLQLGDIFQSDTGSRPCLEISLLKPSYLTTIPSFPAPT
ncbi:hypothetical protein BZA05DRAFT_227685 [Tricharina praecox]|uniref:uncharacterized protein n=1 Tax=Tricharina praecox TaxID=43433 RepID=UPI00221FBECF|nr:uncharacterized protein BZA05DRAFT_227685 [Tricharina praecox]KAI5841320.1 hypothetical protein BZA05DRAFT_227685 [Tricharina praecox]